MLEKYVMEVVCKYIKDRGLKSKIEVYRYVLWNCRKKNRKMTWTVLFQGFLCGLFGYVDEHFVSFYICLYHALFHFHFLCELNEGIPSLSSFLLFLLFLKNKYITFTLKFTIFLKTHHLNKKNFCIYLFFKIIIYFKKCENIFSN